MDKQVYELIINETLLVYHELGNLKTIKFPPVNTEAVSYDFKLDYILSSYISSTDKHPNSRDTKYYIVIIVDKTIPLNIALKNDDHKVFHYHDKERLIMGESLERYKITKSLWYNYRNLDYSIGSSSGIRYYKNDSNNYFISCFITLKASRINVEIIFKCSDITNTDNTHDHILFQSLL